MEHNGHHGPNGGHRRRTREEGLVAIARLEQLQEQWQERYRQAQRASDELSARQFTGQSADRAVRVVVDGSGQLAEVRIDRRRAEAMSSADLSAAVIAAVRAARQDRGRADADANREVLGFDVAEVAERIDAPTPAATGNARLDAMFGELHAFRAGSREAAAAAAGATATAESTNKLVSATCTATEITELWVDDGLAHPRRLAMAEQSITEAIRDGHAAAARKQAEQLGRLSVFGLSLGELMSGRLDPHDLVRQLSNAVATRNQHQEEN